MEPSHFKRTHQVHDLEDLACLFIEEEVGRHDWRANWEKRKARGVLGDISEWLDAINVDANANEIFREIDKLKDRPGSWR